MNISEIKAVARQKLTGKWGRGAFLVFGYTVITFLLSLASTFIPVIGSLALLVIQVPMSYGIAKSFLDLYNGEEVSLFDFLSTAINNFSKSWSVAWHTFLKLLVPTLICFLASLISGIMRISSNFATNINMTDTDYTVMNTFSVVSLVLAIISLVASIYSLIRSYQCSLSTLIAMEEPGFTGKEAVAKSMSLMKGNVGKYFLLQLSFIGWSFLTIFTLGIGSFWLLPYIQLSIVAFYKSLNPDEPKVVYEVDNIVNGTIE